MADNFNTSDQAEAAGPKSVAVPASIADGTAGELMTWDAAGVAALVAVGTATHVLTSNGAGAAPTFQVAGGGGAVTSVFSRVGVVVAVAGDYAASEVTNDSGVTGAFVDDALDTLAAAVVAAAGMGPVDSVFSRTGVVVAAASDYDASQVDNDSSVAGAFVDDALNNLRHAACQARRTTDLALATSFGDVDLDTTDVEIDAAIIDHDLVTDDDRIIFGVAGTYEIHYHFDINPPASSAENAYIESRVRVNDTTVIPGSLASANSFNDSSIEGDDFFNSIACSFFFEASAADFISLQAQFTDIGGGANGELAGGTIVLQAKRVT